MTKIIAIDHGNSSVKCPGFSFPSGLAEAAGIASEVITYEGKDYALSHKRVPYQWDKSASKEFLILTLFAIARQMTRPEETIVLAVGLPPAHFKALRGAFESYFQRRVEFWYNDSPRRVNVEQVYVFPQAYAAAMTRAQELFEMDRAWVIDIGGMTVDALLLRNAMPDMSHTMSLDRGVNILLNDSMAALAARMGIMVEQDQVEAVLRGGNTMLSQDAQALIFARAKEFAKRLLADLRERGVDLTTTQGVFVGGGPLLLRKEIERSPTVRNPVFVAETNANAMGYQLLTEELMKKA